MKRSVPFLAVLFLFASAARAGTLMDFDGVPPPPGTTYIGNAGTGSFTPPGVPQGTYMFGASTGVGTTPFGTPVAAGSGPASFFTGNPHGGTGLGPIIEYSGISFPVTLTVPSFITVLYDIATEEFSGGEDDLVAVYVDSGLGPVLERGWGIDWTGSATYASPFSALRAPEFTGSPGFTDPFLGTFGDGSFAGGFRLDVGTLPAGTHTIYILVGDFSDSYVDTAFFIDDVTITEVPEPGTWLLFGLGALGLVGYRRFRHQE